MKFHLAIKSQNNNQGIVIDNARAIGAKITLIVRAILREECDGQLESYISNFIIKVSLSRDGFWNGSHGNDISTGEEVVETPQE